MTKKLMMMVAAAAVAIGAWAATLSNAASNRASAAIATPSTTLTTDSRVRIG